MVCYGIFWSGQWRLARYLRALQVTTYLCYKFCMIPVKHFVERLASRTYHIRPRIHAFDHVTDTVTDLRHASNTDLE